MVNKRGQMKIQQMAFMMIAVFLFLSLAVLFFFSFSMSNMKKSAEMLEEKEARFLVSKIANSPEFSCQNSFGTSKVDCVDFDKLRALKSNMEKYSNFWNVKKIEIWKLSSSEQIECTPNNYPNCNYVDLMPEVSSGVGISNFVTICRKEQGEYSVRNKCELGEIIITYEAK